MSATSIVLTILQVIGGIALVVAAGAAFSNSGLSMPSSTTSMITAVVAFVANVLPFALLAYGLIGDLILWNYRLSIPSLAALGSVFIVGFVSRIIATGYYNKDLSNQDTFGSSWCTLPGLEVLESPWLPTAFLSTGLIATYYLCWIGDTNGDLSRALSVLGIVWGIQLASFLATDCASSYFPIFGSVFLNIILSTGIGALLGLVTFSIVRKNAAYNPMEIKITTVQPPNYYDFGNSSAECPAGTKPAGNHTCKYDDTFEPFTNGTVCENGYEMSGGKCVQSSAGHSKPVQAGEESTFVAELYKNGKLVTAESIAA
jgi:hypothetical protein